MGVGCLGLGAISYPEYADLLFVFGLKARYTLLENTYTKLG